jgi:flagellin
MPQFINTNVASLNTQRALNMSQGALQTSLQRLSSGLRINSAKDDAAGLAISERMTSQIRGLNQAVRNANDGISLAQTAEGSLQEITNNLQRVRELAIQSANATNSSSDRAALDQEVQQLLSEIDRVASQTSFNGQKVLDGNFGNATFQVGDQVGQTISLNLATSMKSDAIGQIAQSTSSVEVTTANLTGTGTIAVGLNSAVTIGTTSAGQSAGQSVGSAYAKANSINAAGVSGLTATASNNIAVIAGDAVLADGETFQLRINGTTIFDYTSSGANTITAQTITDTINANSNDTGVSASLSGSNLLLSTTDGRDIAIGMTGTGVAGTEGVTVGTAGNVTSNGVTYYQGTLGTYVNATDGSTDATAVNGGRLTLTANEAITITGDGAIMGYAAANSTIAKDSTTISTVDVKTVSNAEDTIYRIDSALTSVSDLRSTFGAVQNRFESVIANLQATSENVSAARSRIRDTDFAAETAELTRNQIIQQAGIAMLSQANAAPQNVLALLQ